MGVPDGGDGVGGGVRGTRQHLGQLLAARLGGARHVAGVDGVDGTVQGAQDLVAARGGLGELVHQLIQHLHVMDELPDRLFSDGELGRLEHVQMLLPSRLLRPELGPDRLAPGDGGVGGQLDQQVHRLPAARVGGQQHAAVVRVQALDRGAVGVVHQPLGLPAGTAGQVEAEVEDGLDTPARPLRRDLPGNPEPGGGPRAAPALTEAHRDVGGGQRLGDRDRFPGYVPGLEGQGAGVAVERGGQVPSPELADPTFDDSAVVMHGAVTSTGGRRWWAPDAVRPRGCRTARTRRPRHRGLRSGDRTRYADPRRERGSPVHTLPAP